MNQSVRICDCGCVLRDVCMCVCAIECVRVCVRVMSRRLVIRKWNENIGDYNIIHGSRRRGRRRSRSRRRSRHCSCRHILISVLA